MLHLPKGTVANITVSCNSDTLHQLGFVCYFSSIFSLLLLLTATFPSLQISPAHLCWEGNEECPSLQDTDICLKPKLQYFEALWPLPVFHIFYTWQISTLWVTQVCIRLTIYGIFRPSARTRSTPIIQGHSLQHLNDWLLQYISWCRNMSHKHSMTSLSSHLRQVNWFGWYQFHGSFPGGQWGRISLNLFWHKTKQRSTETLCFLMEICKSEHVPILSWTCDSFHMSMVAFPWPKLRDIHDSWYGGKST